MGFINKKNTWASQSTIWAPYNQFLAPKSQVWNSGRMLDIRESFFYHWGWFVLILGYFRLKRKEKSIGYIYYQKINCRLWSGGYEKWDEMWTLR